jgi:CelD/BcsL family acetyltransferase involved in cellulose biosynthesis
MNVSVLRSGPVLAEVAAEWDDLYARSPGATPFLSHAWLSSHARHFPAALRITCVRDSGGRLVAAFPLRLHRRAGLRTLRPLGAELADYSDALVDTAVPDAAAGLASALRDQPGWDLIDLPEVRPGSAAHQLTGAWPGPVLARPGSNCLELPIATADALLCGLPAKSRQDLRRALRRAARLDAVQVTGDPADVSTAIGELLDLHARQWQGRPVNPLHHTGSFHAHLREVAQRLVPAGAVVLVRHLAGGVPVAVSFFLLHGDTIGGYLYGAHPDLRRQLDVAALMIRTGLDLGRERGAGRLNMLRGEEAGKLRWQPTVRPNQRITLPRPGLGAGGAATLAALATHAVRDQAGRSALLRRMAARLRTG